MCVYFGSMKKAVELAYVSVDLPLKSWKCKVDSCEELCILTQIINIEIL